MLLSVRLFPLVQVCSVTVNIEPLADLTNAPEVEEVETETVEN